MVQQHQCHFDNNYAADYSVCHYQTMSSGQAMTALFIVREPSNSNHDGDVDDNMYEDDNVV
jgi:hypothetical protein